MICPPKKLGRLGIPIRIRLSDLQFKNQIECQLNDDSDSVNNFDFGKMRILIKMTISLEIGLILIKIGQFSITIGLFLVKMLITIDPIQFIN